MSDVPLNEHLEGILSDFEALKRSFDTEDVDDIPSPLSPPLPPSSCHFFVNHGQAAEAPGAGRQAPPFTFGKSGLGSGAALHARRSAPPCAVVTSCSFGQNVGGSVSSFSTPSGPGSDDSLHSSTSSLENSGLGGFTPPPATRGPYGGPHPHWEYGGALLQLETNKRKASYQGNVWEVSQRQRLEPGATIGSVAIHDLRSADGVTAAGLQEGGGKHRAASAAWNGRLHNGKAPREERHRKPAQQQPGAPPRPKAREPPPLNKFPLDLDSLVFSASAAASSPAEAPASPTDPEPAPLSSGVASSPPPPPSSVHPQPLPPPCSPSLMMASAAQTFQVDVLPGPQGVQAAPCPPRSSSISTLTAPPFLEGGDGAAAAATDTVDLILQRIASFSSPAVGLTQPDVRSSDESSAVIGRLTWRREEPVGAALADRPASETASGEAARVTGVPGEQVNGDPGEQVNGEQVNGEQVNGGAPAVEERAKERRMEEEEEEGQEEVTAEREMEAELRPPAPDPQVRIVRGSDLLGYVGIEAVLDQMRRRTMKDGFEFNIMVVGQSGLGKSTLVNTLFKSKISRKSCSAQREEKIPKTVTLHSVSHVIEEKGVKMKLTVVDTPGFGDQINNENCWEPIEDYVNQQYEKYLREELHVTRQRRIPDSRVHCCVYFLPATGHRLRPIDVEFMKRLGKIVSVVPVIAKADTLTVEERGDFKERIRRDLAANGIVTYPQEEYDEDPEERILNDRIRESLPFAVVGTDQEHQVNGSKVLGRKTKWGIIEVENVAHCEFSSLRDLLIRSHLQDLKDVTHNILYEKYRVRRLDESRITFRELRLSAWPLQGGARESDSHL